ncbi:microtubule associated protein 65 [Artemisia annua]|uniref:Microtubule associated protein 65 n=1 Tax=Artemisia annua TaxID=35608 RepID=A0A2U1N1X4_ARTAN|nr:microtubule associated protein 65 [Artemisia annua]
MEKQPVGLWLVTSSVAVLGFIIYTTVTEVHQSLNDATGVQSKSISNDTLARIANTILALNEDKKQRLKKLQELATQLIDLWNLMDMYVRRA